MGVDHGHLTTCLLPLFSDSGTELRGTVAVKTTASAIVLSLMCVGVRTWIRMYNDIFKTVPIDMDECNARGSTI